MASHKFNIFMEIAEWRIFVVVQNLSAVACACLDGLVHKTRTAVQLLTHRRIERSIKTFFACCFFGFVISDLVDVTTHTRTLEHMRGPWPLHASLSRQQRLSGTVIFLICVCKCIDLFCCVSPIWRAYRGFFDRLSFFFFFIYICRWRTKTDFASQHKIVVQGDGLDSVSGIWWFWVEIAIDWWKRHKYSSAHVEQLIFLLFSLSMVEIWF